MPASLFRSCFAALVVCGGATAHAQTQLPDGAGKEILQNKCVGCHELSRVLRAGYTAQDWSAVLHMMKNAGAQLTDDQMAPLVAYLAQNFPEKPKPQATVVPGSARVSLK